MGANEKYEAAMHGGEYTPSTEIVRRAYAQAGESYSHEEARADTFNRWLESVRADAKAEALEEAADEINRIDPAWDSALWIEPKSHYVPLPEWLRERANQYKEAPSA